MEAKTFFNYISEENNAKISFCTSEYGVYKCSNILSTNEKVSIYHNHQNILLKIEIMGFPLGFTSRNNHRYIKFKSVSKNKI